MKFSKSIRLLTICALATIVLSAAQTIQILETGSSLLYPLFNLWAPAYSQSHPDVRITTASTGSGTGISQAVEGIAQIGASDAYMSDAMMKQHPNMLNIPLAISSQMINYNLPGLNQEHLKLSGPVLAAIYQGKITHWNDPQIAKLNSGVNLPNHAIITVHRSDSSGDTFIFTQYLSFSTPDWEKSLAYGTTISWPAISGALGAVGNPGMITAAKGNPYSIAYIGISYEDAIHQNQLGTAMLQNHDGNFVLPDDKSVQAAADAMVAKTPKDERISLIFAAGADSYPIINYEYVIVGGQQPSREMAGALRDLLNWAISPSGGNSASFMKQVHFVALPSAVSKLSEAQIARIQSSRG
jgi:phosphate transport system substrate-binding protein